MSEYNANTSPVKKHPSAFSGRMYREALAQLVLPGSILAGILFLVTLLLTLSAITFGDIATPWFHVSNTWAFTVVFIWTAPFLLTLLGFSFLRKRTKSDFYHALPIKRGALFTSYAAAIFTWIIAPILVSLGLNSLILLAAGASFDVTLLVILAEFLTAGLFAAALSMLAVSLSGTVFSNIVLMSLFLLLPSLIASTFRSGVIAAVPTVPATAVSFFGFNLSITLFGDFGLGGMLGLEGHLGIANALWTLVITLVLMVVAAFFFIRRKSEMAGSSASSPKMQALYRIAIALPPLIIVFGAEGLAAFTTLSGQFSLFVALLISLILMVAFELITTKRWQNLLKIPLSFGLTLLVTAVFVLSIWGASLYEASFAPEAHEVERVRIVGDSERWGSFSRHDNVAIYTLMDNRTAINDSDVNDAVAEQIRRAIEEGVTTPLGAPSPGVFDVLWGSSMWDDEVRLIFEVRTTSGATRQRSLSVGRWDWSSTHTQIRLNDLGEALEQVPAE
ncbi:MAG: hypothetical protein FWC86_03880 [Coriobacteriia bacterium]|nr:hypothetical protein [Coriobacteriia bacterium]